MKVPRNAIPAAVVLFVLAGTAAIAWKYLGNEHERRGHLVLPGNVDVRQVNLAFKVPGRVATLSVDEGDRVTAGRIVAALEREDFEDQLRLTRAQMEARAAALAELEAGTRPQEIEQARALVAQREASLELARATLKRIEPLTKRDFASHQVHDEAQARVNEAEAQLRAARKTLGLAEEGPRTEDIAQARAQLNAARAELDLAKRRLADTKLVAPNDGVILTRVREPGAIVAAGATIYTLTLTRPVWVRTYVEEPDLGRIHPGMEAEVRTDSGGIYKGRIGFISPRAEFTPKTVETRSLRTSLVYRLRVIVDKPDEGLRQGMPVTVLLGPGEEG
ncbi:MAG: secretion protein HlyD [Alphaproteobacteria bacterium]